MNATEGNVKGNILPNKNNDAQSILSSIEHHQYQQRTPQQQMTRPPFPQQQQQQQYQQPPPPFVHLTQQQQQQQLPPPFAQQPPPPTLQQQPPPPPPPTTTNQFLHVVTPATTLQQHSSYLPQTPNPHIPSCFVPTFRFPILQIPTNFLTYSYTYTNSTPTSTNLQIRPPVPSGFTAITNGNGNVSLQTNNTNAVKALPAPALFYSGNKTRENKRLHAIPIINPITKKNIFQDNEAPNDVSVSGTSSDSNISSSVNSTQLNTIWEDVEKSTEKNIPEDNSENDPELPNSSPHFRDEKLISEDIEKLTEGNIPEENSENESKLPNSSPHFRDEKLIKKETFESEIQTEYADKLSLIKPVSNNSDMDVENSEPSPPCSSQVNNNEEQSLERNSNDISSEMHQKVMGKDNVDKNNNNNNGSNRRRLNMGRGRRKRYREYYGRNSKYENNQNSKNNEDNESENEKHINVAENKADNDSNTEIENFCEGATMITPTMEFTHSSKINELENDWKGFIQNEMKLSPEKSSASKNPQKILTIKKDEDKNIQKQKTTNDKNDDSEKVKDLDENLKINDSKISPSQSTKNVKKQYKIDELKAMRNLPASKIRLKISMNNCSVLLQNMRKTQKSSESNSLNKINRNSNENHDGMTLNNKNQDDNHNNNRNTYQHKQHHHNYYQQQQYQHKKLYKGSGPDNNICCGNKKDSVSNNSGSNVTNGNTINVGSSSSHQNHKSNRNDTQLMHLTLGLNESIKLNESENAWKPSHLRDNNDKNECDEVLSKVRGILNKLTPEKFDALVKEILQLSINTMEKVNAVMMLVFEKAIDEPNFSASYALLCKKLADKSLQIENNSINNDDDSGGLNNSKFISMTSFKTALLNKTEKEFNINVIDIQAKKLKLKPNTEQMNNCTDDRNKFEIKSNLEEEELKFRRRSCGTMRFIGELFKISMLTGKIIRRCILSLLDTNSEDKLECLCKLLKTVGQKYENTLNKETKTNFSLNDVIKIMQSIIDREKSGSEKISSRVRFMLQDVVDLRENNWNVNHIKLHTQKIDNASAHHNDQKQQQQQQQQKQQQKTQKQYQQTQKQQQQQRNNNQYQRRNDNSVKGEQNKMKSYSKKSNKQNQNQQNQQQHQGKREKMQQNKFGNDQNHQNRQYNDRFDRDERTNGTSWFKRTSMQSEKHHQQQQQHHRHQQDQKQQQHHHHRQQEQQKHHHHQQEQQQQQQNFVDTNKLNSIFNVDDKLKFGNSSLFMWRRGDNNTENNSKSSSNNDVNMMATKQFQELNCINKKNQQQYQRRQLTIRSSSSFSHSLNRDYNENTNLERTQEKSLNLSSSNLSNIPKDNGIVLKEGDFNRHIKKNFNTSPIKKFKSKVRFHDSNYELNNSYNNSNNNSNKINSNVNCKILQNDNLKTSTSITLNTTKNLSSESSITDADTDTDTGAGATSIVSTVTDDKVNIIGNLIDDGSEGDTINYNRIIKDLIEISLNYKEKFSDCLEIWNELPQKSHSKLFYTIFALDLYEIKKFDRKLLSNLIQYLIRHQKLNVDNIIKGYNEFCKYVTDIIIDVPHVWQYIFEFIGPLIYEKIIRIEMLWNKQLFIDNMGKQFLKSFINYFLNEYDNNKNIIIDIWNESNLKWSDYLLFDDSSEIEKFIIENDLKCLKDDNTKNDSLANDKSASESIKVTATTTATVKNDTTITITTTATNHHENNNDHDNQTLTKIAELLTNDNINVDYIINYLNNIKTQNRLQFIRDIMNIICEYIISYNMLKIHKKFIKFNKENFRNKCIPILIILLDSNEECELECLNSIKLYVMKNANELLTATKITKTKTNTTAKEDENNIIVFRSIDLMKEIFFELLDSYVIAQETFSKWYELLKNTKGNEEQQQESHKILFNLKSFFDSIMHVTNLDDIDN